MYDTLIKRPLTKSRKRCKAEQSRAEQSRAEQSRAEQSRAEQSRAEQSRAEQSRAEQRRAARAEQNTIHHLIKHYLNETPLLVRPCSNNIILEPMDHDEETYWLECCIWYCWPSLPVNSKLNQRFNHPIFILLCGDSFLSTPAIQFSRIYNYMH